MSLDRPRSEPDLAWAAGCCATALALRLVHLLTVHGSPFFRILYIDPLWYDEWAQRIAGGKLLSDGPFFLDPLYPYFLAAIFRVFGHHHAAVAAVQSLLGSAVPGLVLLAARRWYDSATARAAGAIAAVYLPAIYFDGLLMKPALASFLIALTLWLASRALSGTGGRTAWLGIGLLLGLACLTRGNLLLVVPVLAAWLLLRAPVSRGSLRIAPLRERLGAGERWREVAAVLGGVALVVTLPTAHNWIVGHELILTTANAGANFYIGNNPSNRSGEYQQLPFVDANPKYEQRDFRREAERRAGRPLGDREVSVFWFGESWRWIRSAPGAWLGLLLRKLHGFWGAWEIPDSLDYYFYREYAPVLRLPIPGFGLLAPLALAGAALSLLRRGWPRLLLVLVGTYCATIVFFFVFSRFRMVLAPALYVLAGHAGVELVRRTRDALRRRAPAGPALVAVSLFVVFLAFVNLPVRARTDGLAYRVASTLRLWRVPETSAHGHFNLGVAYAGKAKEADDAGESGRLLELAESELRAALTLRGPANHARYEVELGKVLARRHHDREAIEVYRRAATIEPGDYRIFHALGILHRREGELAAAADAFRRATELAPQSAASQSALRDVLSRLRAPAQSGTP